MCCFSPLLCSSALFFLCGRDLTLTPRRVSDKKKKKKKKRGGNKEEGAGETEADGGGRGAEAGNEVKGRVGHFGRRKSSLDELDHGDAFLYALNSDAV